jgi:hypothetical protein
MADQSAGQALAATVPTSFGAEIAEKGFAVWAASPDLVELLDSAEEASRAVWGKIGLVSGLCSASYKSPCGRLASTLEEVERY